MCDRLFQVCPKFDSIHLGVKCSGMVCVPVFEVGFSSAVIGVGVGLVTISLIRRIYFRKGSNNAEDITKTLTLLLTEVKEIKDKLNIIEVNIGGNYGGDDKHVQTINRFKNCNLSVHELNDLSMNVFLIMNDKPLLILALLKLIQLQNKNCVCNIPSELFTINSIGYTL